MHALDIPHFIAQATQATQPVMGTGRIGTWDFWERPLQGVIQWGGSAVLTWLVIKQWPRLYSKSKDAASRHRRVLEHVGFDILSAAVMLLAAFTIKRTTQPILRYVLMGALGSYVGVR